MRWCCAAGPGTPLLEVPPAPVDLFGPMHIRVHKTAVLVTEASDEGAFLDRLKSSAWSVSVAAPSTAAQAIQQLRPVLVLLDNKLPDLPALAKTLHHHSDEDVLFSSISERPLTEKRRKALCQADVQHNVLWNSRDISLVDFVAKLTNRLRVMPALLAVLDEADQAIEVCDDSRVVQYVNRAYETVTGCLRQEVIGQPESDVRRKSLPRPRDDQLERRRSSDWKCIRVPSSSLNSLQYVYMKRRSVDGAMYRDVSLKSLKSQSNVGTDTAPISEVLSMLRDAAGRIEGEPAHLVRDAMKALTSHEMYGSSLPRVRDGDRIANQYYDGLVRLHHQAPRQRKRSVVDAYKDKRGSHGERRRVSADVKNALENDNTWSFDILNLERVADNHVLTQLGMKIFDRWKVTDVLNCNEDTLLRWMTMIEMNYRPVNAYHNATHASDVLQATSYFLDAPQIAGYVNENHAVAAIIAAAVHDLDHPGRGNAYLINTRQQLAIMYNDHSVLENHHVSYAFQLTLTQSNHANIFGNLGREEFAAMRIAVVEMVLATDISRHFEYLKKFNSVANTDVVDLADDVREANSLTVCNMLVKCADISNPVREWSLCQKWAFRIVEEYFDQTKEEREKGLPFTMSLFDRNTCNVPATQTGFIDMFVREAFSTFADFAELTHLSVQLEQNYKKWEELKTTWTPANNQNLQI